jgi:hypothetical protein
MPNCLYCKKSLSLIGIERNNGVIFQGNKGYDWEKRKYHKKCFKLNERFEEIKELLDKKLF